MSLNKLLWGGLGWAMFGPIGGILGYAFASASQKKQMGGSTQYGQANQTRAGDFGASLLVLFASVMKADGKVLKSELDFVKKFFVQQMGTQQAQELMMLFKGILEQNYSLREVCVQVKQQMDHASRLELLHVLFGLSNADGHIDKQEINTIHTISGYLGISAKDFSSIRAMFVKNTTSSYKILEVDTNATDTEIKKAYRKMATKYHPDKVHHLGEDFQKFAEDKFKMVNNAYQKIKSERGFS
jgi:DnaJ like chaperone protein